jgi:bis(5'-nucleosidyl)-tetraphosphatase
VIITARAKRAKFTPEHSAGTIIYRKEAGRVLYLLLHYEEGHWGASKGHVENAETTRETAAREVREETGLTDIRFIDGFREEIAYYFTGERGPVHKSVVFLLAEAPEGQVRLSCEHTEYLWLPFAEALEKTTFADEKSVLRKAGAFLDKQAG